MIPPIHFPGEGALPRWLTVVVGGVGFAGTAMFFIFLFFLAGA